MKNKFLDPDFYDPIYLIIVGCLLLANTTGYVSWEIWLFILQFWPVLFIIWGLELIFSGSNIAKVAITYLSITFFVIISIWGYQSITENPERDYNFPISIIKEIINEEQN